MGTVLGGAVGTVGGLAEAGLRLIDSIHISYPLPATL